MQNLQVVEHDNQRIMTTQQLADGYGTSVITISNNFNRNKKRYEVGKHYFLLEGEELQEFKTIHQIDDQFKRTPKLYLWTERGALLHAKSLNTPQAWDVYEELVDTYFRAREVQQQVHLPTPRPDALHDRLDRLIGLMERQYNQPPADGLSVQEQYAVMLQSLGTKFENLSLPDMKDGELSYVTKLRGKRLLTKFEAAAYIGICYRTLDRLIDKGGLPVTRIGFGRGRVFIDREKLDQWLDEQDGAIKALK